MSIMLWNILNLVRLLTIILAVFSLGIHQELFRLQRGIRGVPRHIAVMMGARASGFNPRTAYSAFRFDSVLLMIVSIMFFFIFNWMWAFGFILLYFVGLPFFINIFIFFFRKRISQIRKLETSSHSSSVEESLTKLNSALESLGITATRKKVLPEDTNKFLVKFIKKKPEDKSKE